MKLNQTLKGVSRSFYLSLKFLPRRVRQLMKLAFLACKAADTIADTKLVPLPERLDALNRYRSCFVTRGSWIVDRESYDIVSRITLRQRSGQAHHASRTDDPNERALLESIPQLFAAIESLPKQDQQLIRDLVAELTQGMIHDLSYFPGEDTSTLVALQTEAELDQYTYYVAGCVGRFWSKVLRAHYDFARHWNQDSMERIGEDFGKGLQMVNILRDLPRDLQNGRCYLPAERLSEFSLTARDLLSPTALARVKPYLEELLAQTRDQLRQGAHYAMALPSYALRLRWVVIVPMKLGFQTLDLLENSEAWLDPQTTHKVPRSKVYRTMFASGIASPSRPDASVVA